MQSRKRTSFKVWPNETCYTANEEVEGCAELEKYSKLLY